MNIPGNKVVKYVSKFKKINPNGLDLVPQKVFKIPSRYTIYIKGNKRGFVKAEAQEENFLDGYEVKEEITPDENDFYHIPANSAIEIVLPEIYVPLDMLAIIFPRSTFNRLGIIKSHTGLVDSGYKGTPTQTFYFPTTAMIHKDEAWVQICFFKVEEKIKEGYTGFYQNKKI